MAALDKSVAESLPLPLDATADLPPVFDGTTRNYKGLQDKIKLVPLNLPNRPSWYAEKVYPVNKVPTLEHNGKIIGESLDLIKYVDSNFEGPSLLPDDPAKKDFAEELFAYYDKFSTVFGSFKEADPVKAAGPSFDYLENALTKFDDGPFFLGSQFSLADIAYIPFVERLQIFFADVYNYDITSGRPKLATWFEIIPALTLLNSAHLSVLSFPEIDKIPAYNQTKTDPKELVAFYKERFLAKQ